MDDRYKVDRKWFPIFLIIVGSTSVTLLGILLGISGSYASAIVIGICAMAIIFLLRQDELAAVYILAIHLYVDWYLGLGVIALPLACALLVSIFLRRSPEHCWQAPRHLWLWGLFLLLSIFPALHGISLGDTLFYYFNIIAGALLMFWLGIVIVWNTANLKRVIDFLSALGTLVAIHAIIQATTGYTLFATDRFDSYFATISDYIIADTLHRTGSFLINPDSSGSFFAMMLLLPLGLFSRNASMMKKIFYSTQIVIITIALLFSYSTGGWAAAGVGLFVFIVLIKQTRYRLHIIMFSIIIGLIILCLFPQQLSVQIQHASTPSELLLRQGAWKTGIQVIRAFPLTGVGLGRYVYIIRAEPYRVIEQYRPLTHPHNSYLELAALAGIPLLVIFVALLVIPLWSALYNWIHTDIKQCPQLSGGIAAIVALSFNSFVISGWTLAPLAAIGWFLLGCISSPLLLKAQSHEAANEQTQWAHSEQGGTTISDTEENNWKRIFKEGDNGFVKK
ncbi:O-antigen ligase family protein [Dictyobacter formicarum]|nr:O-antigen ligase family protein [Dictyobacter formicarum]